MHGSGGQEFGWGTARRAVSAPGCFDCKLDDFNVELGIIGGLSPIHVWLSAGP